MMLVKGHMLANALLCPDLKYVTKNYKNVTFYLDTPILLQILNLVGKENKEAIDELIILVKKLNGKIAYFSHTKSELESVITTAADCLDRGEGYGSIVLESRAAGRTRSDLILIAETSEERLAELEILVQDTPPYTREWQIDEEAFEDILLDEVGHYNPRAKGNDVNSVRSIYVLRKGSRPRSLEQCKAVLVTSNSKFAQAAQEYGQYIEESEDVSTVITDFSLSNISWLKMPLEANLLPQREVLAFAYAALCPSKKFWDKVLKEVERLNDEKLIDPRYHQIMRSNPKFLCELFKLTLGDESGLSENSMKFVAENVINEIKKEESEKLNESERKRLEIEEKLKIYDKYIEYRVERRVKRDSYIATTLLGFLLFLVGVSPAIVNKEAPYYIFIGTIIPFIMFILGFIFDIKILKFQKWYLKRNLHKELEREKELVVSVHDL